MMRNVLIIVILVLLGGCSAVRLGYNSADTLLAYRMDDWFNLPETLSQPARERLGQVLGWHRKEELPRYAGILHEAEGRLADPRPLQAEELLALQRQVAGRLLLLGDKVAEEFADLIVRFGPGQRRRLLAKLEDSNDDFRKEQVQARPAALRKRRIDQLAERHEFWLGRLEPRQRERIEQYVDAHDSQGEARLALRQARQQAFVAMLDEAMRGKSVEATARQLRAFFAGLEMPADERARARAELTAELFNMATPAQRDHARSKLRGLAEDFRVLAGQRPAS